MRLLILFLISASVQAQSINFKEYFYANGVGAAATCNSMTECFQDAVDLANSLNTSLYLPAGTYNLTAGIDMHAVSIKGDGMNETILKFNVPKSTSCLTFSKRFLRKHIEGIAVHTWSSDSDITIINFQLGVFNSTLKSIDLSAPWNNGNVCNNAAKGIYINTTNIEGMHESDLNLFETITFRARFKYGFYVEGEENNSKVFNANKFDNCRFSGTGVQVRLQKAEGTSFSNCTFASNGSCNGIDPIRLQQLKGNTTVLDNCYFDGVKSPGFITIDPGDAPVSELYTPIALLGTINDIEKITVIDSKAKPISFMNNRLPKIFLNKFKVDGLASILSMTDGEKENITIDGNNSIIKLNKNDRENILLDGEASEIKLQTDDQLNILFDGESSKIKILNDGKENILLNGEFPLMRMNHLGNHKILFDARFSQIKLTEGSEERIMLHGKNGFMRFNAINNVATVGNGANQLSLFAHDNQLKIKDANDNVFVAGSQKIYKGANLTLQTINSSVDFTVLRFQEELINLGGYNITNGILNSGDWGKSIYEVNVSINFTSVNSTNAKLKCRLFKDSDQKISKYFYSNTITYQTEIELYEGGIDFYSLIVIDSQDKITCKCKLVGDSDSVDIQPGEAEMIVKRIADSKEIIEYE